MARSSTPAERTGSRRRGSPPRVAALAAPTPAPSEHALYVASIAKCFEVLEALNTAARPVALTELAALARMERSAVQRITHTLAALGYLRQHPQSRAFTIAGRMLDFGHTVLATDPVRAKAYPHLERLNAVTGETVNLMELEGHDIVYVARFPSAHAVSVDLHVGSRLPAFCTAAGRAILSRLPEADAIARLSTAPRRAMTDRTVTALPGLKRALAQARREGYAFNDQEAFVGDLSVAAALVDRAGAVVGAINIAVPSPRWSSSDVKGELAPLVMSTAREIATELGAS